jgi:hypothetical protein
MTQLTILAVLLTLASPAWATTRRYTTYEEKTLHRLHTVCDDGTRAVSTYNKMLERWDTTITTSPRRDCPGRLNSRTHQVEMRCR